jgi:putative oxidoreductase
MKYAVLAVRTLLGLAFVTFALDYFLHFLTLPKPTPTPAAQSFMDAIYPTNYLTVVKVIEISGGVLLLTGLFVPLGLVLLTPVIVNIALFDMLLMRTPGLGVPFLAAAIFLIWSYRSYFAAVFTIFAKPGGSCGK